MYIKIDGRCFDINFSVFETLSKPVIIGIPFLKSHKAVISFDHRNCITINLPKPVYALNDITMSPYCEYLCQGHVTKNYINTNGHGECSVRD